MGLVRWTLPPLALARMDARGEAARDFVIPGGLAASLAVGLILIGGESQTTPCVVRVGSIARCVPVTRTITSPSVLDYLGAIVLVMAPIMTAIYLASRGRAGASARLAQNPVPSS